MNISDSRLRREGYQAYFDNSMAEDRYDFNPYIGGKHYDTEHRIKIWNTGWDKAEADAKAEALEETATCPLCGGEL